MGTTTLVCQATGTVPDFHVILTRCFSQHSSTMSRAFSNSAWISSTPSTFPDKLLNSATSASNMGETFTRVLRLAFPTTTLWSNLLDTWAKKREELLTDWWWGRLLDRHGKSWSVVRVGHVQILVFSKWLPGAVVIRSLGPVMSAIWEPTGGHQWWSKPSSWRNAWLA